jgi:hypothetical protein
MAIEVFAGDGYKMAKSDLMSPVFEKEGSKMNNFSYGSWLGDTPVYVRVKTRIVPLAEMSYRLGCKAYMVRDIGSTLEEEIALSGLRSGPYQKLLDQVASRLNPLPSN